MEAILEIYRTFWEQCFNFKGTTSRNRFWLALWCNVIIYLVIVWYTFAHKGKYGAVLGIFVFVIYTVGMISPTLALFARRYKDVGLSGWWLILTLVAPLALFFVPDSLLTKVIATILSVINFIIVVLPRHQLSHDNG